MAPSVSSHPIIMLWVYLHVAFSLFFYGVTYNYVLWTEVVSEINYWIELRIESLSFCINSYV